MIELADIQGHWLRRWIKAPGFEDHTTEVHWMQAGAVYADVRVPLVRPLVSGFPSLGHAPPEHLLSLLGAEGFAGHVSLKGNQCTWHRDVNWHGAPDAPDVGHIAFNEKGRMIETGVHADYTELWEHLPRHEYKALKFVGGGYAGFEVSNGSQFVLAIGRPNKAPIKPAVAALKAGAIPMDIENVFDGIHAFGHRIGKQGMATLATNPFYEGQVVVTMTAESVIWHRIGFDGTRTDITLHAEVGPA